jgi:deazaflavin-dependent oxidoreductase (nitroreductase family)
MEQITRANMLQRMMQRFASIRPVAFVFRHTFHHIDRALLGVLGGRTLSAIVAGVPNVMLTTIGAHSGEQRTVPVIGLPVDAGLAIVGTRFGSQHHPGWYHNLRSHPMATVARHGASTPVRARQVAAGDEYDSIMRLADEVYLGFPKYRARIDRRQIPVFVLEPA